MGTIDEDCGAEERDAFMASFVPRFAKPRDATLRLDILPRQFALLIQIDDC